MELTKLKAYTGSGGPSGHVSEQMSNKGTTDMARLVPAEEEAVGEASEWELRERREREEEQRAKAEELGAEGEAQPLCLPTRNSRENRRN